jgi:N-acetylglucosamine-6-phosphate deacetylase
VLTDTREQTLWCIEQFKQWENLEHKGAELLGIHLEGPFLCPAYKGAMPEHLLQMPNLELLKEYQEAAEGRIRYITVSPELDGMVEFIAEIGKLGLLQQSDILERITRLPRQRLQTVQKQQLIQEML